MNIDILSNDFDPDDGETETLSVSIIVNTLNPQNGSVEVNLTDNTVSYTPNPDFVGSISLSIFKRISPVEQIQ